MGLEKSKRAPLEAGLKRLLTISDVRPCPNGEPFEWSDVVFDSPRAAGQAVAAALERATCASVAGEPVPPGKVRSIQLAAKNGSIAVTWLPPHDEGTSPIEDYAVQCRPSSGGPWVGSTEGVSTATSAVVDHLTNGTSYGCEVAAVSGIGSGEWAESPATAMPIAPPAPRTVPAAPAKPTAEAGDKSARLTLPTAGVANVSGYRYECSTDGGATWPVRQDVPSVDPATQIASLTNGASYVCRAFAENPVGLSGSSSVSDAFRPCGSLFECNPVLPPILGLLGLLLLALLLAALLRWWTGRSKRWITADVDGLPPVLLGRGPLVGLALVRNPGRGTLSDVMPDPTPTADMRIRFFGGDRFEVKTDAASVNARTGQSVVVSDTDGTPHDVTLRAFSRPPETNAGEIDQPTWGAAAASDGWGQPIAATGPQPTAASDQGWD
jgi:hypothetical protein